MILGGLPWAVVTPVAVPVLLPSLAVINPIDTDIAVHHVGSLMSIGLATTVLIEPIRPITPKMVVCGLRRMFNRMLDI